MAKVTKLSTKRSHLDAMLNVLTSLRDQELYTDVTLVCGENEVKAHSLVLHASSPYFQKRFEEQKQREERLEIDDIDPEVIKDVIHFLYTGELVKKNSLSVFKSLQSILEAAYVLVLPSLVEYCWKDLSKLPTCSFFKELWDLADLHSHQELINQIVSLLANNFFKICRTPDFLELKAEQLSKLLQSADSGTSSTTDWMLNGILQWVKHKEQERHSLILDLLPFVDVELLSSNYLAHVLNSETLVTDNREQFQRLFAVATARLINIDIKPDITQFVGASEAPIPAKRRSRKQASTQPSPTPVVRLDDSQDTRQVDLMTYVEDKMLVCTGKENENDVIFMYDLKKKTWALPRCLPFSVASGTAVVAICGFIYYIGGDNCNDGSYLVNKYHLATDTGSEAADLEVAVTQAGAATTHDKIYVVGGINNHAMTNHTQRYDPETDEWVCVAPTTNVHGLPNVLVLYDELFVVGSYSCCDVETYDSALNQWTLITEIPSPLMDKWPRATTHQDRIWLWKDLEEQKFHIYDVFHNEWEEKVFKNGPKKVYGMWSTCSTLEHLEFIVISAPGHTYYAYHSESESWVSLPDQPGSPSCYYWQTVLV